MANPETSLIREISRELSLLLSLITPSAHFSQVTDESVSVIATYTALDNRKWHTNVFLYIDLAWFRFFPVQLLEMSTRAATSVLNLWRGARAEVVKERVLNGISVTALRVRNFEFNAVLTIE